MQKIRHLLSRVTPGDSAFAVLAGLCFVYALYIAIHYAGQVPLDQYAFRQTQTALTAYWLAKDGFSLAYETPVANAPWSIPFEFPIYQYIVALLAKLGAPMNVAGRLVSFVFLALCLWPARAITQRLGLPRVTFYIFVVLLFSSPLYLYWGRSFMIETAAIFFTVAGIKYFVDISQGDNDWRHRLLFIAFMSAALLQKATTALPVIGILGIVYLFLQVKNFDNLKNFVLSKKLPIAALMFGLPLALCIGWTIYTDHIKSLNETGAHLTSQALAHWNWGSWQQRLSADLYHNVIWKRLFKGNMLDIVGMGILTIGLLVYNGRVRVIGLAVLTMGFAPLFLFTNLHLIHTYYQNSCLIFLLYGLALYMGQIAHNHAGGKLVAIIVVLTLIVANEKIFAENYLPIVRTHYDAYNSNDFAVGSLLHQEVPGGKAFIAFGKDWDSSLTYMSGRKSFSVANFDDKYNQVAAHPDLFMPPDLLGAVVVCAPVKQPSVADFENWAADGRDWKIGLSNDCLIAVPETTPVFNASVPGVCEGTIDVAGASSLGEQGFYEVRGWVKADNDDEDKAPLYVILSKAGQAPLYLETLRVNRRDSAENAGSKHKHEARKEDDSGFSRAINVTKLSGSYTVGLGYLYHGQMETCGLHGTLDIEDGSNDKR